MEYDPTKDLQVYAETAAVGIDKSARSVCPTIAGGTNFWPASYSRRSSMLYIPTHEGCSKITVDTSGHVKGRFNGGRAGADGPATGALVMLDPVNRRIEKACRTAVPEFRRRAVDRLAASWSRR